MLFSVSVMGLLIALSRGAWGWAMPLYGLSGVMWIVEMRRQRVINQPMGFTTLGGTLYIFFLWPLSAFYWYYGRWQFRRSRFRVCPHEDSPIGTTKTVLGEFGSWEEAVSFAKELAMGQQLQIDVLDTSPVREEPWIFYVVPTGKIYRLEQPSGMSEYAGGNWRRI